MAHALAGKPSPFAKARETGKRFKAFFWGPPGSGKTWLGTQFPNCVALDMEQGTEYAGGVFSFDRLDAYTSDEVDEAVAWLLHNPHPYTTLLIDPITKYWQQVQEKWTDIYLAHADPDGVGHHDAYYELQPKDWQPIKRQNHALLRNLMRLDMNVIVTAHSKALYSFGGGDFMKEVGRTFDGEKSLPYVFDIELELFQDDSRYMARVKKDRPGRLPKMPFECSYQKIAELFGVESLERETKQIAFATDEQVVRFRELLAVRGITEAATGRKLAKYGANSIGDLTAENAAQVIALLESAPEKKPTDTVSD